MNAHREPPITLNAGDYETLSKLAEREQGVAAADYLAYELDRARISPEGKAGPATVGLGSNIRFRDLESGEDREVVLVMPNEADIKKGFISVLTPVGAALLGLAVGQTISFTVPSGQERSLRVAKITPPRGRTVKRARTGAHETAFRLRELSS